MNMQFGLLLGTFLAGVLLGFWIKGFKIRSLESSLEEETKKRLLAERNQVRTEGAANVVVEAERKIVRAGDFPKPHGLGVLLDDARVSPRDGPSGTSRGTGPGVGA